MTIKLENIDIAPYGKLTNKQHRYYLAGQLNLINAIVNSFPGPVFQIDPCLRMFQNELLGVRARIREDFARINPDYVSQ